MNDTQHRNMVDLLTQIVRGNARREALLERIAVGLERAPESYHSSGQLSNEEYPTAVVPES